MEEITLEAIPERTVIAELKALSAIKNWTAAERRQIRDLALRLAQRYTPKHFMDLGRRIAWSTVSDLHAFPNRISTLQSELTPSESRALLSAIMGTQLPSTKGLTGSRLLIRYVLSLNAWSTLLERKFQLSNWWTPFEYGWLLESRVLGYQGARLESQVYAHRILRKKTKYPAAHNDDVIRLWQGEIQAPSDLGPLRATIPAHCFQSYRR